MEWLKSAFLVNYFTGKSNAICGVTWFLAVLVLFYVFCSFLLPFMRKKPRLYLLAMLSICTIARFTTTLFGPIYYNTTIYISYIPVILFGQMIYFLWSKKISFKSFAVFATVEYWLCIKNISFYFPQNYDSTERMGVSLMYGSAIFIIALLLKYRFKESKIVNRLDTLSFALYLNHMPIAQLLLPIFIPLIGITLTVVLSFAVIFFVANLQCRLLDWWGRFINHFARKEKRT
jgi:peptidoglycan/LPS O-acetylase OafA/YrhL